MKWRLHFYNERRGILARYDINAPLPAEAVVLGRKARAGGASIDSAK